MPTFAEIMANLNTGLGNLNTTPLGQFGTQMLMASGPQAGNPGGGARLGQAMSGMQQMQAQQQQLQQQAMLRQIQQAELLQRGQKLDRENQQQTKLSDILQSPDAAAGLSPIQRQLLSTGLYTPADVAKIGTTGQPKQATPPGMYDMPQPDGTYIRNVLNPKTGQLEQSVPFMPPQAQTAAVATDKWSTEKPFVSQEQARQDAAVKSQQQNADSTSQRVAMEQQKAQREADANTMKSKMTRIDFKNQYMGAVDQLGQVESLANEIANDKALPSLYGKTGYIPPVAGSDAASLQTKINRLQAMGGLTELVKLKQNGVSLTPVSNTDLIQAQSAFANFDKLQGDVQAKETFLNAAKSMTKAKEEAARRFNEYDSLYSVPGTSAPQNQPHQITDDTGYNALPSGAQFTGPDGVLRRKP